MKPIKEGPPATNREASDIGADVEASIQHDDIPEQVRTVQARARAIVRSNESAPIKLVALANLVDEVNRDLTGIAYTWAREAIMREAWSFVVTGEVPAPPDLVYSPPKWISAPRKLRAAGNDACPECWRVLPSERLSDHLEGLDRAAWAEATAFEGVSA